MFQKLSIKSVLFLGLLLGVLFVLNNCKKDDDIASGLVQLNSFGPSPALRGGELHFIGVNLDKVTAIVLPNNVEVTTFKTKTSESIVIDVPKAAVAGKVTLKTPNGDITSKSLLTISEPIAITSFSPAKLRPGATVTIEGTYLNLIKEVIFSNKKSVTAFKSQTETKLEVVVPADAQSGLFVISNGLADPILIESATPLEIITPVVSGIAPSPVKAGGSLTITGTDLDLTKEVTFPGGSKVSTFESIEAGKIVLKVPANSQDGSIKLSMASLVEVSSTPTVTMLSPTISSISPNPAKTGGLITVKGKDLDLVTSVTFGGNKTGTIQAERSESEMQVRVPADATVSTVSFGTAANKSVTSADALKLVKPSISSITPTDIQVSKELIINGNDLDIVAKVKFSGGKEVDVKNATASQIKVIVPVGTTSGTITLVANNGDEVASTQELNILASTSSVITKMPTTAKPGQKIRIEGENLDEISEVIFPGEIAATMFGAKSNSIIEVVVPIKTKNGIGKIKFITTKGETIESPEINFQGIDPVADLSLVFFNFDGLDRWWGDAGANENDPNLSVDGSKYFRVNQSCNGWTGFFWRNGANNFPGSVIGTQVGNYVLKFDVNVLTPITGGEFAWRLKGSEGDFWYRWKPWEATGSYKTDGWITVTVPITAFSDGSKGIVNLASITEDFGVAFNAGSSSVNVCIDNVRFEKK
ncbi:MAG: glycan-binding surface protein [Haliscomenobacter sp.]|uniref:glycan-binding surface protein n=1 Tax=Haliscomenobacter sp. TaxID=2717303 RepID=UPI0029B347DA|nr:glycan-binding surface protein [Haliscomenobacter sp.]MDX2071131.1 glycan-binding surface protein [Haliscomenobacter sp.]